MELDTALEQAGGFGRFQVMMFVLMGFVNMRGAGFLLGIVFVGDEPSHHCSIPANATVNHSIPMVMEEGQLVKDKCHQYIYDPRTGNKSTAPCRNGWKFDTDYESTVVTEWSLVCDQNYLVELSTTIFILGLSFGSIIISPFSDKFGRKWVLIICLMMQAILGIGLAFVTDIYQFIVLRFFIGALNRAIDIISFVLMTECFPAKHRTWPCIYNQMFWGVGLMLIALLAYFVKNWRYLELSFSVPILLMISYAWFVPESMRWLLSVKKDTQANKILQRVAKMNGTTLPVNCLSLEEKEDMIPMSDKSKHPSGTDQKVNDEEHDKVTSSLVTHEVESKDKVITRQVRPDDVVVKTVWCCPEVRDRPCIADNECALTFVNLCCHPKMRRYTTIVCFLWMVNSLDYYGISMSTSTLAGNRYLNFFISAAVELPAYVLVAYTLKRYGRRKSICAFHIISGVANIISVIIPLSIGKTEHDYLITVLAMIGKFGITGSFCSMFLYSAEVFPTIVRNSAIGFASFWDTVGGMAAPFILYAAKTRNVPELPRSVFGSFSLIAGILTLLLPETANRPLPETIADVESWHVSDFSCKTIKTGLCRHKRQTQGDKDET